MISNLRYAYLQREIRKQFLTSVFLQNLLLQPPTEAEYASGHPLGIPILKVADFGFARSLPAAALAETLCGSPLYMAPEILRYEKYDAKADLWSVGAVLFEMAVGKPPFKATNHVELLKKIERNDDKIRFPDEEPSSRDEMEDYSDLRNAPPVANDIKELIRKLLKKKPVMRMGFNEFFDCSVWAGCMKQPRKSHHPAYSDSVPAKTASGKPSASATNGVQQQLMGEPSTKPSAVPPQSALVPARTPRLGDPRPRTPGSIPLARERSANDGTNELPGRTASARDIETETSRAVAAEQCRMDQPATTATRKHVNGPGREPVPERASSSGSQRTSPESRTPAPHQAASNRRMSSSGSEDNPSHSTTEAVDAERKIQDSDEYVVVEKRNVEVNVLADGKPATIAEPDDLTPYPISQSSMMRRDGPMRWLDGVVPVLALSPDRYPH